MNRVIAPGIASLVLVLPALAQPPAAPQATPPQAPPPVKVQPARPPIQQQPPAEKFWTETDSKLERFDGLLELVALSRSKQIDASTMERVKSLAVTWYLDVQQQVIDNTDFIDEIEPFDGRPGFFEVFDPAKPGAAEKANTFQRQLNSAGQFLSLLDFRRVLDQMQSQTLRRSVYEYDQALLREVVGDGRDQLVASRHLYKNGYRDAMGVFHRLLDRAATKIDDAVAAAKLSDDTLAAVKPLVAAVKASKDQAATRTAVKAVLAKLTIVQRRLMLNKVRDAAPVTDPFSVL